MAQGDAQVPGRQLAPAGTPAPIRAGLAAQGMDQTGNFAPGRPLQPYFGYSTPARGMDFPVGVNIATQGRAAWNRVGFDVIKAIINAYDVARICIDHKIDELRSMELMFQPADGVQDDVDDEIDAARLVLSYPDRELPYEAWIGKWLENYLKYDNAPLYKRRDYDGNVIALEVVDGSTVHPYIDGNGRRPEPPAPMAWQVVHGMVGTWFTRDDLIYVPFRPQEDSPYGLAPIESALLTANTDIRTQWHFLQMFTDGSVPAGFMELPPDVSQPEQVREWQDHWDAVVMGDQAKLHQLLAVPNGSKFTGTKPAAFDKEFPNHLMRRMCAKFGVVAQDANLTDDINRATGETQTDIQFRVNTLPWVLFINGILTRYLQKDIGLRVKVSLDTGRDKEDRLQEAQAHDIYVKMGAESVDEVRVDVLGKPIDKERPTPRFLFAPRIGAIPLLAIEGVAGLTDSETFGPSKAQKALDQPFVPPIGIVPMPGTTDDKAAQAAVDAYQVSTRRQMDSQTNAHRETEAEREARGAAQTPGTGDAPLLEAPQGSQAQQQAEGTVPAQDGDTVRKALGGAEAAELLAFREYVRGAKRRGYWRDFVFKQVAPQTGAQLNQGARAEVGIVLKAKAPDAPEPKGDEVPARQVYDQLSENFPPDALQWVLDTQWTRQDVPLDGIDWSGMESWHASRQPEVVAKLAKKMGRGKGGKPAVAVDRPGKPTVMLADGHHHALAHRARHEPVPAYVAHVGKVTGPWDELHSHQEGDPNSGASVAKAASMTKAQARYRDPSDVPGRTCGTCSMFREGGSCTLVQGAIDSGAVCDHWEARDPVAKGGTPGLTKRSGMISLDLEPGTVPAVPGGVGDHHVTIVYLGPDVDDDAFAQAVTRAAAAASAMPSPVTGTVGGIDTFEPSAGSGGLTPAFAPVDLPGAHELRAQLADLSASEHDTYHPHVTLAYLQPGQDPPQPVANTPVEFTHLSVHRGPQVVRIPFGPGGTVSKAAGDPKGQAPPQGPDTTQPQQAQQWPGWQYDLAAAAYWTPLIAAALGGAFTVHELAEAYAAHRRGSPAQDRAQAQADAVAWLQDRAGQLEAALTPVVRGAVIDGYLIGDISARATLALAEDAVPIAHTVGLLGGWSPGNPEAARRLLGQLGDGSGLQEMLDQAGITIKSIAQTRLNELGRALADGAERGDSTAQIAADIRDLLTNKAMAHRIASTELARAVSAAAVDHYTERGYRETEWLDAGDDHVCPEVCEPNAAQGPVRIGMPFLSGALAPPGHPECRCAPGVVISSRGPIEGSG